jgi:hypothetical protein
MHPFPFHRHLPWRRQCNFHCVTQLIPKSQGYMYTVILLTCNSFFRVSSILLSSKYNSCYWSHFSSFNPTYIIWFSVTDFITTLLSLAKPYVLRICKQIRTWINIYPYPLGVLHSQHFDNTAHRLAILLVICRTECYTYTYVWNFSS